MKEKETFDIPAYKFGVLKLEENYNELLEFSGNSSEMLFHILTKSIKNGEIMIIPFNNVDGLTTGEVKDVLNLKGPLVMGCYSECTIYSQGTKTKSMYILHTFALAKEEVETNMDKPFDQMIEGLLEDIYPNAKENVKRIIRCFFERYQDITHQDTVERIQKINIRK